MRLALLGLLALLAGCGGSEEPEVTIDGVEPAQADGDLAPDATVQPGAELAPEVDVAPEPGLAPDATLEPDSL